METVGRVSVTVWGATVPATVCSPSVESVGSEAFKAGVTEYSTFKGLVVTDWATAETTE